MATKASTMTGAILPDNRTVTHRFPLSEGFWQTV